MLEFGGVFEEREWRWDNEIMVEWIMFANKPDDGGSADEVSTGGAIVRYLGCGLVGTLAFLLYSWPMPSKGN